MLLGHSLGEYVAACVAGVFSLEDGLALVVARGRLMQTMCVPGAMAAVMADEAVVRAALGDGSRLSVAAVNARDSVVISGDPAAVDAALAQLSGAGVEAERLAVSHAFHSPLIEPMLDEFERTAASVRFSPPRLRLVSNLTGEIARGEIATPAYWRRHVREAVRFSDGMSRLDALGCSIFLEVGPRPTLLGLGRRTLGDEGRRWLPSLRPGRDDWQQVLETAAQLYTSGLDLDWRAFDRDYARRPVTLPTYAFERQRYWIDEQRTGERPSRSSRPVIHPLLGWRLRSASSDWQFENVLDADTLPYLRDHVKVDTVVFPVTAILEMGVAAAGLVFGDGPHEVADLMVPAALRLSADAPVVVQTIVSVDGDGARMRLYSRAEDAGDDVEWRLHATATLRRAPGSQPAAVAVLDEVRARCADVVDVPAYYARMREDGHAYGPSFVALRELRRGAGGALALVHLPAELCADAASYTIHPVLVDAAMQAIGAATEPGAAGLTAGTFVPVSLDRFVARRLDSVPTRAWSVVRTQAVGTPGMADGTFVADVDIVTDEGVRLASVEGICFKRAAPGEFGGAGREIGDLLYEIAWREAAAAEAVAVDAGGAWVVAGAAGGLTSGLVQRLSERGVPAVVVAMSDHYEESSDGASFMVRPNDEADWASAIDGIVARHGAIHSVVHLWNAEAIAADTAVDTAQRVGAGSLLCVAQAVLRRDDLSAPRLCVVTRGAQPVGEGVRAEGVSQAAALGLARSIGAEHPATRCVTLDLDPHAEGDGSEQMWRELAAPSGEPEVVLRGEKRFVARLVRAKARALANTAAAVPVELAIDQPGVLGRLSLRPSVRVAPGPGEVEIEVIATGLNFRDVLMALGMYDGPPGPLGAECVGRIVTLGEGVERFAVGDEVLVSSPGTFRTFVTVPAEAVFRKPTNLSVEEAATLPVAFTTAAYALEHLAGMRRGDRVLVHAAAGGVGLAAVQLAQRAGAEIFATVGSPAKRAYVESLGVTHIMSSRSLDFADQVMAATGGKGVDIVLNSLAGDFIASSLHVLRPGGRFLELGRSGIWTAERVQAERPDVSYHAIYLGRDEAAVSRPLFAELLTAFENGSLRPLPHREFDMSDAAGAFRYMAQARHIGKVVVTADSRARSARIRADSTYLVTGGLGALGLETARWLVERGARHLALIGRSAPTGGAVAALRELTDRGVRVVAISADVSEAGDVSRALAQIDGSMPPLRGIIHAAGVVDDGTLLDQAWGRFETVLASKSAGAWNLHLATREQSLDFFVMYSSIVSVFGGAAQSNYGAANAVLDSLAHLRRGDGLPGLSVNWGPWAGNGMAARLGARDHARWAGQGIGMLGSARGFGALEALLASGAAQAMVLSINWDVALRERRGGAEPPLLADLVRKDAPASLTRTRREDGLRVQIAQVLPSERADVVRRRVMREAIAVLGLGDIESVDPRQPLNEMGLDSLMAVELRNTLAAAAGATLPATLLFRYPTVEALAAFLVRDVLEIEDAPHGETVAVRSEPAGDVAHLDEDEVRRLLAEELESLSSADWMRDAP